MEFQDTNIQCVTCGREFIYTAREQDFFSRKGFKEPRHCRECRQRRKQERESAFSGAAGHDHSSSRELFKIVCANCERETTVPFKPTTGKPVLCKDCFIALRYGKKAPEKVVPAETKPASTPPPAAEELQPVARPAENETKAAKAPPVSKLAEETEPIADESKPEIEELKEEGETPSDPPDESIIENEPEDKPEPE